ncbi:hypothetical protein DFH28DRAFT_1099269 [Melampsora americana]|nr:hypothetical protein DFH28DRAFT_1099269 [Melampsora americana]
MENVNSEEFQNLIDSKLRKDPKDNEPEGQQQQGAQGASVEANGEKKTSKKGKKKEQSVGPIRIKPATRQNAANRGNPSIEENPAITGRDDDGQKERDNQREGDDRGDEEKGKNLGNEREENREVENQGRGQERVPKGFGGIFLDDEGDDEGETEPEGKVISAADRMSKRLDEEIEEAFRTGDRKLYDALAEEKRNWEGFMKREGMGEEGGKRGHQEKEGVENKKKKVLKLASGKPLTNLLIPLSRYWDGIMSDMSRYIPLTIFDPVWLRKDMSVTSTKESRAKTKDADAKTYNHTPIPSEWRTTTAQWHRQKELFLQYLAWYEHFEIIPAMKAHFQNVLDIQKENEDCWMVAFRYDLEMRQAYMTFKVGPDEEMADIGIRDSKVEKRAERETARRNDDAYIDNPYAHGAVKAHIDPIDGTDWRGKTTMWDDVARGDAAVEARPLKTETTRNTQGRNFDPNYYRRREYGNSYHSGGNGRGSGNGKGKENGNQYQKK